MCADGTHGLNRYRYQLYSLMVVDEYGNGIPVAYCFSNKADTIVIKIFFESLKKGLNYAVHTEILMIDDEPTFISAWISEMDRPQKHLLCTWHINKNWLQHLNSINVLDKRKVTRDMLYKLRSALSEEYFKIYIQITKFTSLFVE